MSSFWKHFFATLLALIVVSVIMFFTAIGMLGSMLAGLGGISSGKISVKPGTVLQIDLDKTVTEQTMDAEFSLAAINPLGGGMKSSVGLNDLIKTVKYAASDKNIAGIYLNVDGMEAGSATVEALRNALTEFKQSGKFIYAYADGYSQAEYYLASAADSVFLQPQGSIAFQGLSSNIIFYTEFFKKIGVEMQVIRHGQFKSAVEPYLLTEMSPANRRQYTVLLNSMWNTVLDDISASRNLSKEQLNTIADSLYGYTAAGSLQCGLVDVLTARADVKEVYLHNRLGLDSTDKVNTVCFGDYCNHVKSAKNKAKDKIAVIYAEGEIGIGEGGNGSIGTALAEDIEKAAQDNDVKALVLRVNSPGGAVITADIIYQAMMKVKGRIPVVASYGDYAASGGYWISCMADRIFAEPATLTGSIGVFGTVPCAEVLLKDKLGLAFDGVQTNANASAMKSYTRAMTPYEKDVLLKSIEEIYDGFITRVSTGRGMTKEQVDEIGQGRVWSGVNGLEIGLVDELGGLDDAVAYAAEQAGLTDYIRDEYPHNKTKLEQLLDMANDAAADPVAQIALQYGGNNALQLYNALTNMNRGGVHVWARMPEFFTVE